MKKKNEPKIWVVLMVFMALIAISVFAGSASAATIYVPTDYPSIQQAIDAASSGDTVFVYNGTYYEDGGVTISKDRITLQGEDANTTTIHGKWTADKVVYVTGDYVKVSGFTVAGSASGGSGIYVNGNNCIISDNIVRYVYDGIYLCCSDNSTVSRNNASECIKGLHLYKSGSCVISDNIANTNDRIGIHLGWDSNNCNINNNIVNSNSLGIYMEGSSNCNINNNTINSNSQSIESYSSNNCKIENNNVNSNANGIRLYSSSNCNITNNNVDSNGNGIRFESTSVNNKITENNITNNNYGIYLDHSSNNEIYHNNFIDNDEQAYDHHGFNSWDKGPIIGGNYWSDHVCHGNPSSGEPYTKIDTDSGAVDNYPFEDPDGWVTPPPPLPDLAVSSADISFSPESPYEGKIVKINATVHNIGTEDASSVVVKFFDNGVLIPDVQVIVFIGAGEEQTVSVDWDTTGEAGSHVITVKVDPEDEIEESCETNNEASKAITVLEPTTTIEVKTDKTTYSLGDVMHVKICMKNSGSSRDVMFGWWLTIPKFGYATVLAYTPMTLSADYDDCFGGAIPVGDWGASGFAGIWGVGLFEPTTGEVIDCDTAAWNYKPSVAMQKKTQAEITNEITKEIESVKLPA